MERYKHWWDRLFKTDALTSIGIVVMSGVGTILTATRESAPALTSLGWLIVFVVLAFSLAALVAVVAAIRVQWFRIGSDPAKAASAPFDTRITLRFFDDARSPVRAEQSNIWRWYVLRNVILKISADGSASSE